MKDRFAARVGCVLLLAVAPDAIATTFAQLPGAARSVQIDIPVSPLALALRRFARQSGEQVIFVESQLPRVRSTPISGRFSPQEALGRILSGSGLRAEMGSKGVWIIRPMVARAHAISLTTAVEQAPPAAASVPTADAPQRSTEDEIIVTAQRVAQNLQDVPISVSVVSGDALSRRGIHSLEDLSTQQPSIRIAQGPVADQLHIRGVGSGFNAGFEQSVATFIDGVYRSRSRASRIAMFDIDRVEILKGPQTTFFGANAIAGALNITTRKARGTFEANASALASPSDGEYNIEGGISIPLADEVGIRLAGRVGGMDGYIRNVTLRDKGPKLDDKQGRISFHAATGALTIDARYDIARLQNDNVFNIEVIGCPPAGFAASGLCARALTLGGGSIDDDLDRRSAGGVPTYSNLDIDEGALTLRYDLGRLSLVSVTGYGEQFFDVLTDVGPLPPPSPIGTQGYALLYQREGFDQFSQELRLETDNSSPLRFIGGVYYERSHMDLLNNAGFFNRPFGASLPGIFTPTSRVGWIQTQKQKSETWSGFGSVTYQVTDALALAGSLRYSRVTKNSSRIFTYGTVAAVPDGKTFTPAAPGDQAAIAAVMGQSIADYPANRIVNDAFMPAVNVTYKLNDDIMTYASYARGFKAGGFSGNTPDVFGPEHVDNYEAGIKATWLDRRLVTNLSVYQADYTGLQEAQNTGTASGVLVQLITNAGTSRSRGVDFSTTFRASDALRLRADIGYLNARYIRYLGAPCPPYQALPGQLCSRDASGLRRAFAPQWSGSVGADYDQPISDAARIGVGTTIAFTSRFYQQSAVSPYVEQPGYAKVDARIALGAIDRSWELAVIGRNLTDKQTAGFRNYLLGSGAAALALADRPRSFAVQFSANW